MRHKVFESMRKQDPIAFRFFFASNHLLEDTEPSTESIVHYARTVVSVACCHFDLIHEWTTPITAAPSISLPSSCKHWKHLQRCSVRPRGPSVDNTWLNWCYCAMAMLCGPTRENRLRFRSTLFSLFNPSRRFSSANCLPFIVFRVLFSYSRRAPTSSLAFWYPSAQWSCQDNDNLRGSFCNNAVSHFQGIFFVVSPAKCCCGS